MCLIARMSGDRRVLRFDTKYEDAHVQRREDERVPHEPEGDRQNRDLCGYHRVIRMAQKTIWSRPYQRLARQDENARRPAWSEAGENPDPHDLQTAEQDEQRNIRRHAPG